VAPPAAPQDTAAPWDVLAMPPEPVAVAPQPDPAPAPKVEPAAARPATPSRRLVLARWHFVLGSTELPNLQALRLVEMGLEEDTPHRLSLERLRRPPGCGRP
jgi:hypothetical protein